jgi:hypothetical protein
MMQLAVYNKDLSHALYGYNFELWLDVIEREGGLSPVYRFCIRYQYKIIGSWKPLVYKYSSKYYFSERHAKIMAIDFCIGSRAPVFPVHVLCGLKNVKSEIINRQLRFDF